MSDCKFVGELNATAIGSLPHPCSYEALQLINKYLKSLPFWPQLPRRSELEHMIIQFIEPLPGLRFEGESPVLCLSEGMQEAKQLYRAYIDGETLHNPQKERAAGLYDFASRSWSQAFAVKGHMTGPITLGLSIKDEQDKPILYSDQAMDILTVMLSLSAAWQEQFLRDELGAETIIFLDEPGLASLGSAFSPYPQQKAQRWMTKVLEGLKGVSGVHCCGSGDWEMLLSLDVDIISFDAHQYGEQFCAHGRKVGQFLAGGGLVAWGMVPTDKRVHQITEDDLVEMFLHHADELTERVQGLDINTLALKSLLTPACGLGASDIKVAERAISLNSSVSRKLKREIFGSG